jgi:hypothetical protein
MLKEFIVIKPLQPEQSSSQVLIKSNLELMCKQQAKSRGQWDDPNRETKEEEVKKEDENEN